MTEYKGIPLSGHIGFIPDADSDAEADCQIDIVCLKCIRFLGIVTYKNKKEKVRSSLSIMDVICKDCLENQR